MGQSIKNGPSKICGRQPLSLLRQIVITKNVLKAAIHIFYLVHSCIFDPYCLKCVSYSYGLEESTFEFD